MRATSEIYKGIEFVRISSLPEDQKSAIWNSFDREKIIKILKTDALMNDCILYRDYLDWLGQIRTKIIEVKNPVEEQSVLLRTA
ncbi:MAG: hypothetical protein ACK5RG_03190 [Cyclobacteriaceae bacterium]|jgi:hypothetical protein|nr:hypothetical protein [Flammeovirgaceae bacterium]